MSLLSARTIKLDQMRSGDGLLSVIEVEKQTGLVFRRIFWLTGMSPADVRGKHSHLKLFQVIVCLRGSCRLSIDNTLEKREYILTEDSKPLLLGGLVWRELSAFTADCILLVLADEPYESDVLISSYGAFLDAADQYKSQLCSRIPRFPRAL